MEGVFKFKLWTIFVLALALVGCSSDEASESLQGGAGKTLNLSWPDGHGPKVNLAIGLGDLPVQTSIEGLPDQGEEAFIAYTTSDPAICTVNSDGLVRAVSPGLCTVMALVNAPGYAPTTITSQVRIVEGFINPVWQNPYGQEGTVLILGRAPLLVANPVEGIPAGAQVSYATEDVSVCAVDASTGALSATGVGQCRVVATVSADGHESTVVSSRLMEVVEDIPITSWHTLHPIRFRTGGTSELPHSVVNWIDGDGQQRVYAATLRGLGISDDGGFTWPRRKFGNQELVTCLVHGGKLYVLAKTGGLHVSSDGGENFTKVSGSAFDGMNQSMMRISSSGIIYIVGDGGLAISKDGGLTFQFKGTAGSRLPEGHLDGVAVSGQNVYVTDRDQGVFFSRDGGEFFTLSTGLPSNNVGRGIYAVGDHVYVAHDRMAYSSDGGETFQRRNNYGVRGGGLNRSVFAQGDTVYTVSSHGFFFSSDRANSFVRKDQSRELPTLNNNFVTVVGAHTFLAGWWGGVSVSRFQVGDQPRLVRALSPLDGVSFAYESLTSSSCVVNTDNSINLVAPGRCTIRATATHPGSLSRAKDISFMVYDDGTVTVGLTVQ